MTLRQNSSSSTTRILFKWPQANEIPFNINSELSILRYPSIALLISNVKKNVDPCLCLVTKSISPLNFYTNSLDRAKPIPMPFVLFFLLLNYPNILKSLFWCFFLMPMPLSTTDICTWDIYSLTTMAILPSLSVNLMAFCSRFNNIYFNLLKSVWN